MGVIWGLRSDNASFNARHSVAGVAAATVYTNVANVPQYIVDATAIGGNSFSLDRGSATAAALVYPARGVFSNQAMSILMRIKIPANGTYGLFEINPGGPWLANSMLMFMVSNWRLNMVNEVPTTIYASTLFGTAPSTAVWLDMVVTWDGTTSANALKLWLDGVNVASATASAVASNPKDPKKTSMIAIGGVTGAASTRFLLNEFVIWDTVIDPTNVALVGGAGSLNGASRTAFLDVAAFDGSLNSDPGIANVRDATAYTIAGVDKTGTADIPSADDVRDGVAVDATVGTLDLPAEEDVRDGTTYDGATQTGTLDIPADTDVRDGVTYDGGSEVGTLDVPSLANTKIGVAGDGGVGTYDGGDRWSDPGVGNVLSGVLYKANSLTNNRTGSLGEQEQATAPPPGQSVGIKDAFNMVTRLHSRPAHLKRPGSPDLYSPIRITPSNFFRFAQGPSHVVIRGREFIIPRDRLLGTQTQLITFEEVPTVGEYTLTHLTTTADIAWNANAAAVQVALRAISGLDDVVVTGNTTDGFLVKFFGVQNPLALTAGDGSPTPLDTEITITVSDSIPFSPLIQRGDKIIDADFGSMTCDEVIEMYSFGGSIIGYRVRCE